MDAITTQHVNFINRSYATGTAVEVLASRPERGNLVSLVKFPHGEETWLKTTDYIQSVVSAEGSA